MFHDNSQPSNLYPSLHIRPASTSTLDLWSGLDNLLGCLTRVLLEVLDEKSSKLGDFLLEGVVTC